MNENELALAQSRAVTTGVDPFAAYGSKAGPVGAIYLSFSKVEWQYGTDKKVMPIGTRFAANMAGIRIGWRKWWQGMVEQDRTILLIEQQPEEPRPMLGDMDESKWELLDGEPRDPWQMTNIIELVDPGSGQSYIFSTGSQGGLGCFRRLCDAYARLRRMHAPSDVPLVELGISSYTHKKWGKLYVPELPIVGWLDEHGKPVGEEQPAAPAQAPQAPEKKVPRF